MGKETGNRAIDFFNILNSNSSLTCTGNNSPISPIIFYSFNCFLLEVTPVDPVIVQIINRKAGWPTKILLNQDVPMLPIHPSRLDFRFFAPVGPVHKPVTEDFLIVAFHLVRFLPWNKAWTSDKEMGCLFLEAWVLLNDAIFILYFRRQGEKRGAGAPAVSTSWKLQFLNTNCPVLPKDTHSDPSKYVCNYKSCSFFKKIFAECLLCERHYSVFEMCQRAKQGFLPSWTLHSNSFKIYYFPSKYHLISEEFHSPGITPLQIPRKDQAGKINEWSRAVRNVQWQGEQGPV